MTQPAMAVPIALLVSALTACRRDEPRPPAARASAAAAVASGPQDTAFAGTTAPVHRARTTRLGVPLAMLHAVETGSSPGYDRVVFKFTGDSAPGYHVEYASTPVRRCGSGDPVSLVGAHHLVVRFEPARAHDEHGNPAPVERDRPLGLPAVKEMKLVCDFEGQVEWAMGVAAVAPYRVSELTGPARVVVDIRRRP